MRKRRERIQDEPQATPRMLTIMQVAEALGVGKDTVYGLIKHEGLPAVSVGLTGKRLKLRVYVASLDQWIKEREQASALGTNVAMLVQTDIRQSGRNRRGGMAAPRQLPSRQRRVQSS